MLGWAALGRALVLAAVPAAAQPALGPPFELDAPVDGAGAWGEQDRPRVAAAPGGSLVLWLDDPSFAPEDAHCAGGRGCGGIQTVAGVLLRGDDATPVAVPREVWSFDVAFAGAGYVLLYQVANDINALRIGLDGALIDAEPRLIVPADPARYPPLLLDLECDPEGRCLVATEETRRYEVTAFGWDAPAGPPVDLAFASPVGQAAALAPAADGWVVAYTTDDLPEIEGAGGWVRTQRVDPAGAPIGPAVDVSARPQPTPLLLAAAGDGYAIVWEAVDADVLVTRAGRLDAGGRLVAEVEVDRGLGSPDALVSTGDEAFLLISRPMGAALIGVGAGDAVDLPGSFLPEVRYLPAAGWDGERILLAWNFGPLFTGDVAGAFIDPWRPRVEPRVLSSAANSQWLAAVAMDIDAEPPVGFVAWHDNRADERGEVMGAPFAAGGCLAAPPSPVFADRAAGFVDAVAPAEGGFFVLAYHAVGPPSVARVDLYGRPSGDPIELPAAGDGGRIHGFADRGGGLVVVDDGFPYELLFIEPDGTVHDGPSIAAPGAAELRVVRLETGEIAVVAYDQSSTTICTATEHPGPNAFRITFHSPTTGEETRPPIVERSVSDPPCLGGPVSVHLEPDGLLVIWKEGWGGAWWRAGRLSFTGDWSGPIDLESDGRLRTGFYADPYSLGPPVPVGDELWWLVPRSEYSWLGVSILRTTTDLDLVDVHPLVSNIDGIALLPGLGAPTLLARTLEPPPRASLRLAGHRLDGSRCERPGEPPVGADAGLPPGLDAGGNDAGEPPPPVLPGGGGCGCSTTAPASPACWVLLFALLIRPGSRIGGRSRRATRYPR